MSYAIRSARRHRKAVTRRFTLGMRPSIAIIAVALATIVVVGASRDAGIAVSRRETPAAAAHVAPGVKAPPAVKGADDAMYAFRAEGDALSADIGNGGDVARLDRSGLSWVRNAGKFRATFATRRYGCAGALAPVTHVAPPRAEGRRARVDERAGSAGLEEWAVSGSSGLEQGWNIGASPCASGQVEIEVGVTGLTATASPGGASVALRDISGAMRLHYDQLSAHDASGASLGSRMTTRGDAIVLAIDARRAKFPVVVDPAIWSSPAQLLPQASECTNSQNEPGGEEFGQSVAVSGSWYLIGAPQSGGTGGTGNATFFQKQANGTWFTDEVAGTDSVAGDTFGISVALSGSLAVIGAWNASVGTHAGEGAAYVFALAPGPFWLQQAKLTPSDTPSGFGNPVATDGTTIVVGAPVAASEDGEAYIFTSPSSGTWTQSGAPLGPSVTGLFAEFGSSVAVSGSTLVVGEPATSSGGNAYIYERSGSTWSLNTKLTAPGSIAGFGASVATNGTMVFVGATNFNGLGAVYQYTQAGTGWSGPTEVQPPGVVSGGEFGWAMSLSGGFLAVTQVLANNTYVLPISNGVLSSSPVLTATSPDTPTQTGEQFGISVGLDSNNLIVGAEDYFTNSGTSSEAECGEAYAAPFLLTDGTACPSGPFCQSGFCASAGSVCCNVACSGSCATCASGTCAALAVGAPGNPSCGGYLCNGTMACPTSCTADTDCANGYYCGGDAACHPQVAQGGACNTSAGTTSGTCAQTSCRECASGNCVDGVCCSSSSCGTCQACAGTLQASGGTNGTCSPSTAFTDPHHQCGNTSTCDGAGACGLNNGQQAATANLCASGWLVDGVCCATACSGACDVCTAALGSTADGTCAPAKAGSAGNPACGSGIACNGTQGSCPGTSCTSDSACTSGFYCGSGGTCQPQKTQGTACNTAAGSDCLAAGCRECASGDSCVDGVCCGSASCATCEACAATLQVSSGTNGTCSPALADSNPHGACDAGSTCNGASSCGLENGQPSTSGTACVSGFVADGVCCDQTCQGTCHVCTADAGATKTGTCTTLVCDAGAGNASSSDAEVSDARAAGAADAQADAAVVRDASLSDATAPDASHGDASAVYFERERPNCSCRTVGGGGAESHAAGVAGLAVLALVVARRRRGHRVGHVHARRRTRGARTFVPWMVLALVASPRKAFADSDEQQRATARILATEGFEAFQQQRWADVVDRFGRAESLVHAPPHLLYLARGYVHLGKLVEAHETYEKLTREVLPPSAPRVSVQAQADGAKELSELDPRMSSLTISVSPASSNATVTIDGVALAPAMIGAEVPVDPGTHTIEAKAKGFVEAHQTVKIVEATRSSARLELQPAPPGAVATSGGPGAGNTAFGGSIETPPGGPRPNASSSGLRIGGYVGVGVAVAAAGAGTAFLVESHRYRVDGDSACPMNLCLESKSSQIDSFNHNATLFGQLGIAAFVTAGVAAATGVTLIVLSTQKGGTEPAALWIGPGLAGIRGAF